MVVQINPQQGVKTAQKKKFLCPRCRAELEDRVPRGFFARHVLFFLPIKRYICYRCHRKRYVFY
jgi:transposase-like protein